ncbi:MAG: hypothetical protein ABI281_13350 [Caldimonas sp.]
MVTTAAQPSVSDIAADAESTALKKLREQTDAVVQKLRPQLDAVSSYARDEPTRALLISAATGAALMGLIALMSRSGSRTEQARGAASSTMATIREAALALSDRAHGAANDALGATQRFADNAQKYAADTQKRAQSGADSASDAMSDAWQSLRDQAAPMVDKLRPKIDAVTSYAKEDPARAAMGIAAVGAVLVGLMALIGKSED